MLVLSGYCKTATPALAELAFASRSKIAFRNPAASNGCGGNGTSEVKHRVARICTRRDVSSAVGGNRTAFESRVYCSPAETLAAAPSRIKRKIEFFRCR